MVDPHQDDVAYFFRLAEEQYADISLVFLMDNCPYSRLTARCAGIKKGYFVARVPLEAVEGHPLIWGANVNGYFAVRDVKVVNCHFKSRLARMYNAPPNAMFLVFPLPAVIDHDQRRYSRRVNMDPEHGQAFSVWHGYMSGGDLETPPQMRWQPLKHHDCELGELSANGMRLDIEETNPLCPRMSINDLVLLRGDFCMPKKPAPLYVLGNIVRKMPKPDSDGIICLGCHFTSWRRIDENSAWFRSDYQEGIGLIAQWLSRNFRNINN